MPDQGGAGGGVNDAGGVPQAEPAPAAPETKPEGEDSMDGKRDGRETFFIYAGTPLQRPPASLGSRALPRAGL